MTKETDTISVGDKVSIQGEVVGATATGDCKVKADDVTGCGLYRPMIAINVKHLSKLGAIPEFKEPVGGMEGERVAEIAHEANRAYCASLGDASQASWGSAPDWQKNSAIEGVRFHEKNPDAGPEGSHENWLKSKKAAGWTHGPKKDPEKKQHPCMVPFADLPKEQQAKDFIFRAIVHVCLAIQTERPTGT